MVARKARQAGPRTLALVLGALLLAVTLAGRAAAADADNAAPSGDASVAGGAATAPSADPQARIADIKQRIAELKDNASVDEVARQEAIETYQKALSALTAAVASQKQTRQLAKKAAKAPEAIGEAESRLNKLQNQSPSQGLSDKPVAALADEADKLDSQLNDTRSYLVDLRDQLSTLAKKPSKTQSELDAARDKLQSLSQPERTAAHGGIAAEAERALTKARTLEVQSRIERLQKESETAEKRRQLLQTQAAVAEARVQTLNARVAAVDRQLSQARGASAQSLAQRAMEHADALKAAPSVIQQAVQRNLELAQTLAKRSQTTEALAAKRADARERVDSLERRLNLVQQQLKLGAGSVALGDVLRAQQRALPAPGAALLDSDELAKVPNLGAVQLEHFQYQKALRDLADVESQARQLADKANAKLTPEQLDSLARQLRLRRRIMQPLVEADGRYVEIGRELRDLSTQYGQTLASFRRLLSERLFWLPSSRPLDAGWPARAAAMLPWLFSPTRWWFEVGGALVAGARAAWPVALFAVLVLGALISLWRVLPRRLEFLARPVGRVGDDTMWLTLRAALLTFLLTLPGVVVPLTIGYLIHQSPEVTEFAKAAGYGIFRLGVLVAFLNVFIQVTRSHGLADAHFKWPSGARQGLYRSLIGFLVLLLVPSLVITMNAYLDMDKLRETLGRGAFMLSSLIMAGFAWRLFHPRRGVLSHVYAPSADRWRLGYLWLPIGVLTPLTMACVAALGYYTTALQLQTRFFYSVALIGGATVVYGIIVRWVTVVERRLALERARKRRAEARQARQARDSAAAAGEGNPDSLDEPEIDLPQISEQTRGLIQIVVTVLIGVGLWWVWSNTLPALQALDDITLWHHTVKLDGQVQSTDISLGALLLALAVGVGTALAGRNLPGFLEITLLRRFAINPGSRYAIAALIKYAIAILGILFAIGLIGFRWSSIQWLVAALGVGLGFGLQEIFANFVSGIVILFERPVRVGDTATVGNLTGTVSRVRIRATTITDWDNKEVVIPNKTFITETVVNWTLTDDITRLLVRVRVAFDSDTAKVERLIQQAIAAQPQSLDDPPPTVFMVGYDDSGLIYEARVFYHDLYNWLPLQHGLYKQIHAAFADENVEITFDQQNLHVRSFDESAWRALAGEAPRPSTSEATSRPQTRAPRSPPPEGGDGGGGSDGG